MSLNKLQEHKGELAKIMPSLPEVTTSIYLSKVYDDPSHDWKLVFEKRIDTNTDSSGTAFEQYITKRYIFINDDEVWKILGIETARFIYSEEKAKRSGLTKEEMLEQNLHYVTFENNPVEYIEQYTLQSSN